MTYWLTQTPSLHHSKRRFNDILFIFIGIVETSLLGNLKKIHPTLNVWNFFLHLSSLWDVCCQNTITKLPPPDTLIFSVLQIYHKTTRQRVNETTSKDSLLISINTNFNHPTFNFTPSTPILPFNPSYPFHTLHFTPFAPFPNFTPSLHHSITSFIPLHLSRHH